MNNDEEKPVLITEEYLNAIPYHKLRGELKKLGIESAFGGNYGKGSKKKVEVIRDALKALAVINGLKESGVKEEDIPKQLEVAEAKQKQLELEAKLKAQILEDAKKDSEVKVAKKKNYSKEVLERNLQVIDLNLKLNLPHQRLILLEKREKLLRLLEDTK